MERTCYKCFSKIECLSTDKWCSECVCTKCFFDNLLIELRHLSSTELLIVNREERIYKESLQVTRLLNDYNDIFKRCPPVTEDVYSETMAFIIALVL